MSDQVEPREPIWLMDGEEVEDYVLVEAIVDAQQARRFVEREYDGLDPCFHFWPPERQTTLYPALPNDGEGWRPLTLAEALAIPYEEALTWRRAAAAPDQEGVAFWHIEVHELDHADVEKLIERSIDLDLARRGQVEVGAMLERMIAAMRAAVIEQRQLYGMPARVGSPMAWIENTLDGPDLLPDCEQEKDAQAFFDRELLRIEAWAAERHEAIKKASSS